MTRHGRILMVTIACAMALTACGSPTAQTSATPGESASPSVEASVSPTPDPSLTEAPSASPSAPPSVDPIPLRVEGVTAGEGGGSGEVLLRWNQNPEDDVEFYVVLRASTPGGELTRIGTVTWEEVTQFEFVPFVDTDVTVGYYRVRAVDAAGQEGPKSREVCGASLGHSC